MLVQLQIVSLLNELLNQTARMRKGGTQAVYFCPCCHHYKRKLEFNLETGQWHCWTCNIKGSFLGSFLKKVNAPQSYRDRLLKLTGDFRLVFRHRDEESTEVILPQEFHPLSKPKNTPEYKNAMSYLKRRNIIKEDIIRYNIGFCENGEYAYHIIIPSYDCDGNLNFFIGRRYYDVEGAISYKKPECSMNIVGFESFVNWNEDINLCEGVFDAISIRNNAIPLFGKYISRKLKEKMIINGTPRVNMILDNDALKDGIENCQSIESLGIPVHMIRLSGKDPSVLGFQKTKEFIQNSKQFSFDELLEYKLEIC